MNRLPNGPGGDMARYYSDLFLQNEEICTRQERNHTTSMWDDYNAKRLYWVDKHAVSHIIQELGHMHLLNIHNLLVRRMKENPWKMVIPELMNILKYEIKRRGLEIMTPIFVN